MWIDVLGSSWDLNLEWGTWQFFPIYGPSGAGGIVGGTGGGEPQKKQSEKEKKKSDCFAELKFNEAGHGTPSGVTHSFWYLQNSRGNQYIVTAGPTNPSGKGGNYGALNVWPIQVTNSTMNSGPNKASDVTHWSTGSSPDNCDAVDKLLAAANAFPNNSIPYSPLGPNSNSAARTLGSVAGFSPAAPPGAWGWSVPIHP